MKHSSLVLVGLFTLGTSMAMAEQPAAKLTTPPQAATATATATANKANPAMDGKKVAKISHKGHKKTKDKQEEKVK